MNENCWDCAFNKIGGLTFFGICTKFKELGKEAKEIPGHIADIGCKFYIKKEVKIIDKHKAELDEEAT